MYILVRPVELGSYLFNLTREMDNPLVDKSKIKPFIGLGYWGKNILMSLYELIKYSKMRLTYWS